MAAKKFGIVKPCCLSSTELDSLSVNGGGLNVVTKLQQLGAVAGEPVVTVICKVEGGKVTGRRWAVNGGLGPVTFNPYRVSGDRGVELELDCRDLSKFIFPSVTSPSDFGNMSQWMDGEFITTRLKEGTLDTEDTGVIKEHSLFKSVGGGFCLRLTVVPMSKGMTTLWMSAAPGNLDNLKKTLDRLKVAETSALIPTIGIKITKGMGVTARYVPEEGAGGGPATAKGWGQYPLIQVRSAMTRLTGTDYTFAEVGQWPHT
jgi:hypothetical protein